MQDSIFDVSMPSQRRSRRLASQEPEDFIACSSTNVLEIGDDEQVPAIMKSNADRKRNEEMRTETWQKQVQKDTSSQNSPVALRTRSRSRCSSMESNDAGIVGDTQKVVNIILTPKKNSVKPCRKRTSLMPQLEEIAEEQLKCKDGDNSKERLIEMKRETKKVSKKKRKLSENGRARVEACAERSSIESSNKKDVSAKNMVDGKKSTKQKSWNKSGGSLKGSSAKVPERLLAKNPKKSLRKSSNRFLQDNMKISPAKNSESSLAKILGKSSTTILEKFPEKNREEMLTNGSSYATNCSEQGTEVITETNLEENSLDIWPKLDDLLSLWLRRRKQNILVDNIGRAYAFVNEIDIGVPAISQELITTNSETVWQQIAYGNKKFHRYFTKTKHFLDVEISVDKESTDKRDDSLFSPKFQDESSGDAEEDSTDLFNLTEDEIKRLDTDFDSSKMDKNNDDYYSDASNSDGVSRVSDSMSKRRWKSEVDDHFFSLAEMEEYLDKQEKDQAQLDGNFFEQFDEDGDDLQNLQTDYHYNDFYGSTNSNEEENDSKVALKKLNKSEKVSHFGEMSNRTEKRVTFADEIIGDANCESDDDDSRGDGRETAVLFGQIDEEEDNETEFRYRQKKLQERIFSIEQANLAPRSWDLSGEVTAMERGENTMLEKHFDFDQSASCAPVITVDTTARLEAKIVQRIKDRAFDDVLRTKHKSEANAAYRASVSESEIVKKSLAEVYEEQYQKTQYGVENEKKNEKHEEIKKLMSSLFHKLNALSHYRYIPSEVHPEVRVLSNMPSLQKEEVAPLASTDAVLLAPEEIHKHVSGPVKGDDEKTKTDRSRSHRKKKKWQHIREFKKQEMELTTTKNEIPVKKTNLMSQYDSRRGNMKLTSISFFQRLQTKTAKEVKGKKYKITEMGATKKKLSTNYKL